MKPGKSILTLILIVILAGCQVVANQTAAPGVTTTAYRQISTTSVTFYAETPFEISVDQQLMIEFLDEITGLAISPVRVAMERIDGTHFKAARDLPSNAVIKYRYYREGPQSSVEFNSIGRQVRYRFIFAAHLTEVRDQIAGWSDRIDPTPTGMLEGKVIDAASIQPVGGILIACGGDQVLSNADGSFRFERLRPGIHTLSAMSLDGSYLPFQQEAVVAVNSRTPADFSLRKVQLIPVKFTLTTGSISLKDTTIRIIGDLSQAGNTFADQGGEQSALADLAPAMQQIGDHTFQTTLALPVGQVFNYKYTLGDGFWNSERDLNGALASRSMQVSADQQPVQDALKTFFRAEETTSDASAVSFLLTIPRETPQGDRISIQFNAFEWSPPLEMTRKSDSEYGFTLYGPQDLLGKVNYRYCRNGFCEGNLFSSSGGSDAETGAFQSQNGAQVKMDTIKAWPDWQPPSDPTIVLSTNPIKRSAGFVRGFELTSQNNPGIKAYLPSGLNFLVRAAANALILTPAWEILTTNPLIARPLTGVDASGADLSETTAAANAQKLSVSIFPRLMAASPRLAGQPAPDWSAINPNQWSETVLRFYKHFAQLAQQNSAAALIVDGNYFDWRDEAGVVEVLINIRQIYHNPVLLAAPAVELQHYPKELLGQFDGYYLLLQCPAFVGSARDVNSYEQAVSNLLDKDIQPLLSEAKKPVLLGIDFPSAEGAGEHCYQTSSELSQVRQDLPSLANAKPDSSIQRDVYNAVFSSAVTREWITGLVTQNYQLESARTDASASAHGKPAGDVLWYWFSKLSQ